MNNNSSTRAVTLNCHFSSNTGTTAMAAPGFAASVPGHSSTSNNNNSPSSSLSSPGMPAAPSPGTPGGGPMGFFANPASTYQTHFGDYATGAVTISALPVRSTPGTPRQPSATATSGSSIGPARSALCGGGSGAPGSSAMSAASTPLYTGAAAMNGGGVGFAGSPASAPGSGIIGQGQRSHSNASSGTNSPQTLSITPLLKFASPMTKPSVAGADSAERCVRRGRDAVVAPAPIGATCAPPSVDGVGPTLQELCSAASTSSSASSVGSMPTSLAHTNAPPPYAVDASRLAGVTDCVAAAATGSHVGSPLLFEPEMGVSSTASGPTGSTVLTMGEEVLCEAHKYSLIVAVEGTNGCGGDGAGAGGNSNTNNLSCSVRSKTPDTTRAGTPATPNGARAERASASPRGSAAHHQQKRHQPRTSSPNTAAVGGFAPASAGQSQEAVVSVYDSDFKTLLSIPAAQVLHRPHPSLGVSRLVLCRNFSLEHPGNCSKGEMCKFVHADTRNATRCSIHVNYAWRSLALCTYPRLPPGDNLTILAPNERPPSEVIPSERILVTRGSTNWREHSSSLSHCAHYYFNRMCNRGERCNFIHTVHVDPNVQGDFKRAPAPTAVAPIVSKSPTSAALRGAGGASTSDGHSPTAAQQQHHTNSPHHHSGNTGPSAASAAAAAASGHMSPVSQSQPQPQQQTQPPPPPPPQLGGSPNTAGVAYAFAPSMFAPPGHGCLAYPMLSPTSAAGASILPQSPTGATAPYVMLMNGPGQGYMPAALLNPAVGAPPPPPPSAPQLGGPGGVFLFVPTAGGAGPQLSGSGTPRSPVSPLGQSLSSLSNGPVDWPFYGDLDTATWMPSSSSPRL